DWTGAGAATGPGGKNVASLALLEPWTLSGGGSPRGCTGGRRMSGAPISQFIKHHFRHFNAATLVDAAEAYRAHLDQGGKMFITLAGAMSTAELGISLAEMIRQDK